LTLFVAILAGSAASVLAEDNRLSDFGRHLHDGMPALAADTPQEVRSESSDFKPGLPSLSPLERLRFGRIKGFSNIVTSANMIHPESPNSWLVAKIDGSGNPGPRFRPEEVRTSPDDRFLVAVYLDYRRMGLEKGNKVRFFVLAKDPNGGPAPVYL